MKVLVVDDSIIFRSQISACLDSIPGIEVVGAVSNGRIALQKLAQTDVDLLILDMEMPELDGLATLKEIQESGYKVKVLVFSSQTAQGAEKVLEALRRGAHDVVAKPSAAPANFEQAQLEIRSALVPKVVQFLDPSLRQVKKILPQTKEAHEVSNGAAVFSEKGGTQATQNFTKLNLRAFDPKIIVIASSTGGPNALEELFKSLSGVPLKVPILLVQHMPPVFTQILAKRLSEVSGLPFREATADEILTPNVVRICPGDFHLKLASEPTQVRLRLTKDPVRWSVRPAADYLFETASEIFKHQCLGIVLTGMGEDGAEGARRIKGNKGAVMIQSKESCVVFGMPGAVFDCGAYDQIGNLAEIGQSLRNMLERYKSEKTV